MNTFDRAHIPQGKLYFSVRACPHYASRRGPHGVGHQARRSVLLVVTPDGVDGPTI